MALKLPIFLDSHSTTPVDPRVLEAMLPYFSERFGNAASLHHEFGWVAQAAVAKARAQVASLVGADPDRVIFTSGATESINLAIKGVAESRRPHGMHIVTVSTEHRAVLDACRRIEGYGYKVTYLPVDTCGMVSADEVADAITGSTILVSVMLANNEIGTIGPLEEIGAICRERGVPFHSDATQAAGKIPVDVSRLSVDLLSLSAHKMYGPKGIGALYVNPGAKNVRVAPQIDGGGHEQGVRSGTLNVPAIVGFGAAAALANQEMAAESARTAALRDHLEEGLISRIDDLRINGHPARRLPNNSNLTFRGVGAATLMMDMKDIALSAGSACTSASPETSHVLRAIGLSEGDALSSIRFGLGRFTTPEEIAYVIDRVATTASAERRNAHHLSGGVHEADGVHTA